MQSWEAGDLIVNGVRLHYERTTTGKPPLLFAHGLTDQGRCWLPIAEQLANDYEIVVYDARGHGQSEAPASGYTYDALAADMAALAEALDLVRPVVIGHSMGAATTALAAARYPNLARAIVLEDPPGPSEFGGPKANATFEQWQADLTAHKARSRDELLAFVHKRSPSWPDAELGPWAEAKQRASLEALGIILGPGSPWYEAIEQVACPTLLLTGDPGLKALITPEFAHELEQKWRNGTLVHIPGAGHNIRREQPAAYLAALRAFLRQIDQ